MAFKKPADMVDWAHRYLNPRYLLANLDQYAKLGIPVNVSEITVTAHHDFGNGNEFQKRVAEKLYKLWFSHPATDGIIYWNLVDDTAFVWPGQEDNLMNENNFRGGLLNFDLSPKPVFEVLRHLIKSEWMSTGSCTYDNQDACSLHGFYGDYELTVKTPRGEFVQVLQHAKSINRPHHLKLQSR